MVDFSILGRDSKMSGLFFFKQKTAYEMRISDWSSDVCSSDLRREAGQSLPFWADSRYPEATWREPQSADPPPRSDSGIEPLSLCPGSPTSRRRQSWQPSRRCHSESAGSAEDQRHHGRCDALSSEESRGGNKGVSTVEYRSRPDT